MEIDKVENIGDGSYTEPFLNMIEKKKWLQTNFLSSQ